MRIFFLDHFRLSILFVLGCSTCFTSAQDIQSPAPKGKEKSSIPVPLTAGVAELTPANTRVDFVGTHVGEKPDPRLGGFAEFSGQLKIADDRQSLVSVNLEFSVDSLWTEIGDKLTGHLKNADFLDVTNHPTAKFVSTGVSDADDNGLVNMTGNFTLMGQTQEIVVPVEVAITESGVVLDSRFQIDRTAFGMGKLTDKVSPNVSIRVIVGQPTTGSPAPVASKAGETEATRESP
jgi:polyisoprenoid-binding protein YceI